MPQSMNLQEQGKKEKLVRRYSQLLEFDWSKVRVYSFGISPRFSRPYICVTTCSFQCPVHSQLMGSSNENYTCVVDEGVYGCACR